MKTLNGILMPILATEDKNNTNYMIAEYILKNVDSLKDTSTADLARECNVSKASISRFCKHVGLDDFYTLKYLIKTHSLEKTSMSFTRTTDIFNSFRDSLTLLEKKMTSHDLQELILDIVNYQNVILMGTPQTFGSIITLQHHLSTLGKIVTVCIQTHEQEAYFMQGTENDLIIIFSETGDFLRQVITKQSRMARNNRPKIYLLSLQNNDYFPYVYKTMELGSNSPFVFSTYVQILYEHYKN